MADMRTLALFGCGGGLDYGHWRRTVACSHATYELPAVPLWKVIVGFHADKLQPDPSGSGFFLLPVQPSGQWRPAMAEPDVMRARPRLSPRGAAGAKRGPTRARVEPSSPRWLG